MVIDNKLQLYKKMFFELEQKLRQKVEKAALAKIMAEQTQSRTNFEHQFEIINQAYT